MISKSIKQSSVLFISSFLSVLLGIGVSVLNTSLLQPAEYGDFRYVTNILNFIASLLLFGFFVSGSRCLALSSDEQYSRKIRGVMVIILGAASCVMMILMLGCFAIHKLWMDTNTANMFIAAMPVCFAPLLLNYINTVFQGDNSIYKLSIARVLPSIAYLLVATYIFSRHAADATLLLLIQNGIAVFILVALIFSSQPRFRNLGVAFTDLKRENKEYGFNVYVGSIAAVSLNYLAGITLGIFGEDNTDVGFYTLALTIATPLAILPTVIGTTYFKKFASQKHIDKKVLVTTLILSVGSLLLYCILISPIVEILYDESYKSVALYAQYLAIGTTIHGVGDMFNRFLGSHGKGKELRNGAILCGLTMVIGNTIFVYFWGINGAILTRMASAIVYCGSMMYYYIHFTKHA